jgi:hypothetical protein
VGILRGEALISLDRRAMSLVETSLIAYPFELLMPTMSCFVLLCLALCALNIKRSITPFQMHGQAFA